MKLDHKRIENLTEKILIAVRDNYLCAPTSRDRVYEALNALAISAAIVIKGCDDPDGKPKEFFNKAFNAQLQDIGQ